MRKQQQSLKILIIDDDEVDRMAVCRALSKANITAEFSEAMNAQQGLLLLSQDCFDCVFLDYCLPDQNGLNLIKILKDQQITIPLIVLTGQGDEQIAVEMMKAGASDYLSKSRVSPETLAQVLRNTLRVYEAEKEVTQANEKIRKTNKVLKTQNKELERQRKEICQKNEEIKQASHLKSQFLAIMSHELRTPIHAIMGFSQMLLRQHSDPLTEAQTDVVKRIFDNSKNLLNLLNDVLDFSKIEAGKLQLTVNEFDLGKLVKVTSEELSSLAVGKNLILEVEVNLQNPYIINDQNCIRRILVNLLSNAIKFTDQGKITVMVWELTPDQIAIAVKDTGIGIASEELEHIFEVFRQGDQSLTRKYPGTGLGLAITKSLVHKMQGNIWVESELNQGSLFRLEIPRKIEV